MMNKNITYRSVMRKLLAFVLVVTLVCGMGVAAHAATVTKDLVTLDSPMNLAIPVTYTDNGSGQTPALAFVAPNGQVYQQGMPEDKMTFEQAGIPVDPYATDCIIKEKGKRKSWFSLTVMTNWPSLLHELLGYLYYRLTI
jgi:hypothetical protein